MPPASLIFITKLMSGELDWLSVSSDGKVDFCAGTACARLLLSFFCSSKLCIRCVKRQLVQSFFIFYFFEKNNLCSLNIGF